MKCPWLLSCSAPKNNQPDFGITHTDTQIANTKFTRPEKHLWNAAWNQLLLKWLFFSVKSFVIAASIADASSPIVTASSEVITLPPVSFIRAIRVTQSRNLRADLPDRENRTYAALCRMTTWCWKQRPNPSSVPWSLCVRIPSDSHLAMRRQIVRYGSYILKLRGSPFSPLPSDLHTRRLRAIVARECKPSNKREDIPRPDQQTQQIIPLFSFVYIPQDPSTIGEDLHLHEESWAMHFILGKKNPQFKSTVCSSFFSFFLCT